MSTENTDATAIHTPVVVYIVHHPECAQAEWLAERLFRWFRLGDLPGDAAAAGLPVYYRRQQKEGRIQPELCWQEADLNVVIILMDDHMVVDNEWRRAIIQLTEAVSEQQKDDSDEVTAQIVDRVVLEMLLTHTHRRVARALAKALAVDQPDTYLITWVPDTWTLIALKDKLKDASVQQVIYPGHGLSTAEVDELKPALHTFGEGVELTTYEEVWPS